MCCLEEVNIELKYVIATGALTITGCSVPISEFLGQIWFRWIDRSQ